MQQCVQPDLHVCDAHFVFVSLFGSNSRLLFCKSLFSPFLISLPLRFLFLPKDVRSWRGCGEEEEEAMRKSVSPLPGNEGGSSASTTRVFGVPLEEVTRTHTISGHEVPALVKHIVEYIEEHGEW